MVSRHSQRMVGNCDRLRAERQISALDTRRSRGRRSRIVGRQAAQRPALVPGVPEPKDDCTVRVGPAARGRRPPWAATPEKATDRGMSGCDADGQAATGTHTVDSGHDHERIVK